MHDETIVGNEITSHYKTFFLDVYDNPDSYLLTQNLKNAFDYWIESEGYTYSYDFLWDLDRTVYDNKEFGFSAFENLFFFPDSEEEC